MCFFGGSKKAPAPKKAEFQDAPPVVTGEQTGVDQPKNTAKATEKLRMRRKRRRWGLFDIYVESRANTASLLSPQYPSDRCTHAPPHLLTPSPTVT